MNEHLSQLVVEQLEQLVGRVRYATRGEAEPYQVAVYCELARALDTARRWQRDESDISLELALADLHDARARRRL